MLVSKTWVLGINVLRSCARQYLSSAVYLPQGVLWRRGTSSHLHGLNLGWLAKLKGHAVGLA
jgi:hypothetical protein